MSISDRYLRIMCNDVPNNAENRTKLENLERFLDHGCFKGGSYDKEVISENVDLRVRSKEGKINIINAETGERISSECLIQCQETDHKYGGQILDIAIVKTMLEERPDMSFEDYANEIIRNYGLSQDVMYRFSRKEYHELKEDPELINLYGRFLEDGHLSQDTVDIWIVEEIVEKYVSQVVPIGRSNLDSSVRSNACAMLIRNIIEGSVAEAAHCGDSCIKGEQPSRVIDILKSGLLTEYRATENNEISTRLEQGRHTIKDVAEGIEDISREVLEQTYVAIIGSGEVSKDIPELQ